MLISCNYVFTMMSIFDKNYGNMSFHGNQIGQMVPILLVKNVLLTFRMEQNRTFLDDFKYEH